MKKQMYGVLGAFGAIALCSAAVSADRLVDPAFAPNPAIVRISIGETDRSVGMADYFVAPENTTQGSGVQGPAATALLQIRPVGETDQASGMVELSSALESQTLSAIPGSSLQIGRSQILGETDRSAGMLEHYIFAETSGLATAFGPLPLWILREFERVNRDY